MPVMPRNLLVTLAVILVGVGYLGVTVTPRQAVLFLVGVGAGLVLYHAAFGFTSAWRMFIADGRGAGLRAQMLMLAITCAVFFPLLAAGELFGTPLRASLSPANLAVVVGAFIFGVGMQLGGGCASGTLYSAGGGNTRMLVTLAAFIAGSVIGTAHVPWWTSLHNPQPVSILREYGVPLALAGNLALFAAIAYLTTVVERRRHGGLAPATPKRPPGREGGLRGPWPLVAGAVGLALVNIATLAIAGRPWGVTSAFALWGAKIAGAIGVPVATWPYWTVPAQATALKSSVFLDVTSVMDFGILLGALAAAIAAGRFSPKWGISSRSLAAAIIGGLMLGYGARISYGCNIGAYFSGIASGSLHGWLWLVAAFAGNAIGVPLRPLCDLPVERTRPLQPAVQAG